MKARILKWFSLVLSFKRIIMKYSVLAILIPITVRAVPEVLMGSWPAGFDVITYYAPHMYDVKKYGLITPFLEILQSQTAPLIYLFIDLLAYVIPLDSLMLAKILSPMIYGFLGFAIYLFAKNNFGWKPQKAFLASIITTLYFVTLRLSWDMWKNTIGLAFFLLAVSYAETGENRKFLAYSFLCIFSHELMAMLLGLVLIFVLLKRVIAERSLNITKHMAFVLVILFSFVVIGYYAGWIRVFPQPQPSIPSELVLHGETMTIPYDYLTCGEWYGYESEWDARMEACILMLKMYGPILPLAFLGWKKNKWIDSWTIISFVPFLSIILTPRIAIPAWHRFAFLLAIPFTIHSANFIMDKKRLKRFIIAFLIIFTCGYTVLTPEAAFPYYALFPSTYQFMPTSMLQNSVSKEDLISVVDSFSWLNQHIDDRSCLLVPESYLGWAKLYMDKEKVDIIPYNMSLIIPEAAEKYYSQIYLIWWARNLNWYEWNPPTQFSEINRIGRIVIYEYEYT